MMIMRQWRQQWSGIGSSGSGSGIGGDAEAVERQWKSGGVAVVAAVEVAKDFTFCHVVTCGRQRGKPDVSQFSVLYG